MGRDTKKRSIAIVGPWLPLPLEFLRSRACAELSPHASKLLLDVLSMLGPNASRNGDIAITPKLMAYRGWSSKSSLGAAVRELVEHGLLTQTRQGSRLDCSLYACSLFPLDCDMRKLDVGPSSYRTSDWMCGGALANPPTAASPAAWRRARKTKTLSPPRDEVPLERPATGRTPIKESR